MLVSKWYLFFLFINFKIIFLIINFWFINNFFYWRKLSNFNLGIISYIKINIIDFLFKILIIKYRVIFFIKIAVFTLLIILENFMIILFIIYDIIVNIIIFVFRCLNYNLCISFIFLIIILYHIFFLIKL